MANVVVFQTGKNPRLLKSVDTFQYLKEDGSPQDNVLINPDVSLIENVPNKYWKRSGDTVVEMSQAEKDVVDAQERQQIIDRADLLELTPPQVLKIIVELGLATKQQVIAAAKTVITRELNNG